MTDLRVHDIRGNVCVCDMFSELASQLSFDFLEVERFHGCTGATVNSRLIPDDMCAQWLWEASNRLTEISLEELDHRSWEI